MKKSLFILEFILLCILFVGCNKTQEKVRVSIYVEGELLSQRYVIKGSKLDFDLDDDFYLFLGWTDETGEIDYSGKVIDEDMDIYANVIEMGTRYEINYHINEEANFTGISYPRCYRVGEVTPLVTPNRPYKYEFTGW